MPQLMKPPQCGSCPLAERGSGFAPADGPEKSWLLLVGEALGKVEALTGRPFMGDAGGMLTRLLNLLGWRRDALRIHNVISCQPPGDWFDEHAPWYYPAMAYCPYLERTLSDGPQVVVTMGSTALRRVMGFQHHKKIRVQDFHGSILRDPTDRFWVVPTFHPSFLQRGAHNLIGTVLWDLQWAEEARDHGHHLDSASLVIDPPVEWFRAWVDGVVAARESDPAAYPISSDVETPDKAGGKDEGEITADDRSFQILRINVACHPDEGVTVPFAGPYIEELRRLHQSSGHLWMWNREYDHVRLVAAGLLHEEDSHRIVDLMWLWHFLQSDLPRGLGFVAPLYSNFGPWKHLAESDPAKYGAGDGLQNHRCGFGIIGDLIKLGLYEQAMRHTHLLHTTVLRPAQLVGVKIDRARLAIFKAELVDKARAKLQQIQSLVPEALQPLSPKQGYTRKPVEGATHAKSSNLTRKGKVRAGKPTPEIKQELYATAHLIERRITQEVLVCTTCGATDIQRRHRCPDKGQTPAVDLASTTVTRWYWQEPFNPDSPPQVLAYIKFRKHAPGRTKKTGQDSTDRETLKRLTKTGDPFYNTVIDYRAIAKVKGTYVEGTERRLDDQDRLHPQPTFKPSTMRLCIAQGTPIEILRDVAQYPAGIPIEAVHVGDWAYTFDAARNLTLRRVTWVGQTGEKAVIRIHWAGSNKRQQHGYVDLTPEHEVRLTSGDYLAARLLQSGDRVLSLARVVDRGYQVLNATGHPQLREHRFVQRLLVGEVGDNVHHENGKPSDNRPTNLVNLAIPRHRRRHMGGSANPRWRHDWPEQDAHARRLRGYAEYRARQNNHRIVNVEWLPGTTPVYDLEVAETHNFIANEVCVHNSYVNPNITNVVADKDAKRNLAAGFRRCVVAEPGCQLIEVDFAALEAVEEGWFARDPFLIRLARLGIHSYLIAVRLKDAPDLSASDADIKAHLETIKEKAGTLLYDQIKHTVYGILYGQTPYGLVATWPDLYPNLKLAEEHTAFIFDQIPSVRIFQNAVLDTASADHQLGGSAAYAFTPNLGNGKASRIVGHPFKYRHWFWSVYTYRRLTMSQYYRLVSKGQADSVIEMNGQHFQMKRGPDAARALAFFGQSGGTGVLKEALLRLFVDHDSPSYIGGAYYGRTPLRAPIHDSMLLEVPDAQVDRVYEKVCEEMMRPIQEQPNLPEWTAQGFGPYLHIGVAAKVGLDWQEMTKRALPGKRSIELAIESMLAPMEDEDTEDFDDLGRVV